MTTKEKLKKLQSIKVCVTNMVFTYDMGLQFDVMTKNGVTTHFGCFEQWPCFMIKMDEKTRKLLDDLRLGKDVTNEEMTATDFCRNLTSYHGDQLEGDKVEKILDAIRESLRNFQYAGDVFYAFVLPEDYYMIFKFFATKAEIEDYFVENYGSGDYLYTEMDEDEISQYYDCAEEYGWGGMPYHAIGFGSDDE